MRFSRVLAGVATVSAVALAFAGCSPAADDSKTITIVYQKTDGFVALDELFQKVKPEFEAANPGVTVELEPIVADEGDYATKLALMQQSAETAPDVFYEDTFRVRSDVDAGYLLNLDEYLDEWKDWEQFNEGAKEAGRADDGSVYAVPLGTDTRGIWYSKSVLEAAGVPLPWEPKSWEEILETARAVKAASPDKVAFNVYSGKPAGEGSVMQGFGMLMYGTDDTLYDAEEQKWVTGSEGFVDSLAFIETLYGEGLAPAPDVALDGSMWQKLFGEWFPGGQIAGTIEGSWSPSFWKQGGSYEWPEYVDDIGVAAFPTQNGEGDGAVSLSGGWTLAVGAQSQNPDEAFDFLAMALDRENALEYNIANSQIAVRTDVAEDPAYLEANPFIGFFTDLVSVTHFRPATADYPQISAEIQAATEAVMTGQMSPEEAAAAYDQAVIGIVGDENVTQ
ncbi:extracellular solute-binding protein [Agromyces cerinus]|uniref:Carbohydrate ABC transporter substrate-binding protein, CUT1 family n=1 Tax=Agromyces cerinus subsp. cerinus TaxID=232089 RepID=A0A1N6DG09_9MICO|nr:extracellular solute-binding protein [Agromyces cerinus]SIN69722.1 carbohydrate ABC transporter substrate-binding protein, CUT1 family [Agromyces cerinus subsp. cerinus]